VAAATGVDGIAVTNVAQSPADRLHAAWTGKTLRYWQEEAVAMSRTSRTLYTPLSVATSVAGGMIAGSVFNQIWKRVAATDQPPPNPKGDAHLPADHDCR